MHDGHKTTWGNRGRAESSAWSFCRYARKSNFPCVCWQHSRLANAAGGASLGFEYPKLPNFPQSGGLRRVIAGVLAKVATIESIVKIHKVDTDKKGEKVRFCRPGFPVERPPSHPGVMTMSADTVNTTGHRSIPERSSAEHPPAPVLLRLPEMRASIGRIPDVPNEPETGMDTPALTTQVPVPPTLSMRMQALLSAAIQRFSGMTSGSGKLLVLAFVVLVVALLFAVLPWNKPQPAAPETPELPVEWGQTVEAPASDGPSIVFGGEEPAEATNHGGWIQGGESSNLNAVAGEDFSPGLLQKHTGAVAAEDDVTPPAGQSQLPLPPAGHRLPSAETLDFGELQQGVATFDNAPLPPADVMPPNDTLRSHLPVVTPPVESVPPREFSVPQTARRPQEPAPTRRAPETQQDAAGSQQKDVLYRDTGFPEFAPPATQSQRDSRSASRQPTRGTTGGRIGSRNSEMQRHERSGSSLY